jgi:hypothetical protein
MATAEEHLAQAVDEYSIRHGPMSVGGRSGDGPTQRSVESPMACWRCGRSALSSG